MNIKRAIRDSSIAARLIVLVVGITVLCLAASTAFLTWATLKDQKDRSLTAAQSLTSQIVGISQGPLSFDVATTLEEGLMELQRERALLSASIFRPDGSLFAKYPKLKNGEAESNYDFKTEEDGIRELDATFELRQAITMDGLTLGFVRVEYDRKSERDLRKQLLGTSILASILALLIAIITVSRIHTIISGPISHLARVAESIRSEKNYALRVTGNDGSEIGSLVNSFNAMLSAIEGRENELAQHRESLEDEVAIRTRELTELTSVLKNEKLRAEEATRLKSEFLANMSHEIRTPLNGIIGMIDLMSTTETNGEQDDYIGTAQTSAQSLLMIINDILDFEKAEAGKMQLEYREFSLRDSISSVVRSLSACSQQKDLPLECFIKTDVPNIVGGDPGRISQVISNLVSNAIKFTTTGSVTVRLERADSEFQGLQNKQIGLKIRVQDTGIGIPRDVAESIFEPFRQADGSTTRRFGGTGLGLAICRHLSQAMGGTIKVSSQVNRGSEFTFTMKLDCIEERAPISLEHDPDKASPIIIIDDNRERAEQLAASCAHLGKCARVTQSQEEVIEAIGHAKKCGQKIGAILFQPQAWVTCEVEYEEIRTLLVSFEVNPDGLAILKPIAGALPKPLSTRFPNLNTITTPVRESELETFLNERFHRGKTPVIEDPVVDEDLLVGLSILIAEDNPINQRTMQAMLNKKGCAVTIADNGAIAVDHLKDSQFDIIILDLQMPVMGGIEAARRIRQHEVEEGLAATPIIAATANAAIEDRQSAIDAGMDDFISKPMRQADLLDIVERHIQSVQA